MKTRLLLLVCLFSLPAHAEFIVSSAIVEFTSDQPKQQDIELVSRSESDDYIVAEISEIIHPGLKDEMPFAIEDPADGNLLVTPNKAVLAAGTRKLLRFVCLKPLDEQERIYRVAVKPVIRGIEGARKIGLKVLIGYEVLVIMRPAQIRSDFQVTRRGRQLAIANRGNSNVLLQNGSQCEASQQCPLPASVRVYAGQTAELTLPQDKPVTYTVWDGIESKDITY